MLTRKDWRLRLFMKQPQVRRLLYILLLVWVATATGIALNLQNAENRLVNQLFSSWVGDVLFFSAVGVAVAVASTIPAALEPFRDRAQILFQYETGPHVDYAISALENLGNYAESHNTTLVIDDDQDYPWFRITSTSSLIISNLIPDVITTFRMLVADPPQIGNPMGKVARVMAFTVDGQERAPSESQITGNVYLVDIDGSTHRNIQITREFWTNNGEAIAYTPARYTKHLTIHIRNRCKDELSIDFELPKQFPVRLGANQSGSLQLLEQRYLQPQTTAYSFKVERICDNKA
jgi:hypothetical protein